MLEFLGIFIHYLPYLIVAAQFLSVLLTRRISLISVLGGQVANEAFNYSLKRLIRQPRPGGKGPGYGMPSAHSQFIAFLFIYSMYLLRNKANVSEKIRQSVSLALLVLSGVIFWSRVYHEYHTVNQVVAGAVLGLSFGMAWAKVATKVLSSGALDPVFQLKPVQMLALNDDFNVNANVSIGSSITSGAGKGRNSMHANNGKNAKNTYSLKKKL